jgi:hypothetical protein
MDHRLEDRSPPQPSPPRLASTTPVPTLMHPATTRKCRTTGASQRQGTRRSDPADGPPPAEVTTELVMLSGHWDRVIPAKSGANLPVATWNLRAFDSYTPMWRRDGPGRCGWSSGGGGWGPCGGR